MHYPHRTRCTIPTALDAPSKLHFSTIPTAQGFYPVEPEATFLPGDQLTMACDFDSTNVVGFGLLSSGLVGDFVGASWAMWCEPGCSWASHAVPHNLPRQ